MTTTCIFCGAAGAMILVHGHYQCPVCKTNVLPCCDGDNCSNLLLADEEQLKTADSVTDPGKQANTSDKGSAN
ncbi:MAG TPA: hypothetical protein PLZ45_01650 [Ferruginibacter sp.]|nr:hypothetical protein [Ferruginibacter sp.]